MSGIPSICHVEPTGSVPTETNVELSFKQILEGIYGIVSKNRMASEEGPSASVPKGNTIAITPGGGDDSSSASKSKSKCCS